MPKIKVVIQESKMIAGLAAGVLRTDKVAVVIGKTIYVYGASIHDIIADKKWLLHELKHVQQYNKEGVIVFLLKYIYYSITYGYYNNPYEKEARDAENDSSLLEIYEW